MKFSFFSHSPLETIAFGRKFAKKFEKGTVAGLSGNLGSGKTTLIQGFAEGLGVSKKEVKSPTFVFFHIYNGRFPVYHFDLYRIEKPAELETIGFEDFAGSRDAVSLIEWSNRAGSFLPKDYLKIDLKIQGEEEREFQIQALGPRSKKIVQSFVKHERSRN